MGRPFVMGSGLALQYFTHHEIIDIPLLPEPGGGDAGGLKSAADR